MGVGGPGVGDDDLIEVGLTGIYRISEIDFGNLESRQGVDGDRGRIRIVGSIRIGRIGKDLGFIGIRAGDIAADRRGDGSRDHFVDVHIPILANSIDTSSLRGGAADPGEALGQDIFDIDIPGNRRSEILQDNLTNHGFTGGHRGGAGFTEVVIGFGVNLGFFGIIVVGIIPIFGGDRHIRGIGQIRGFGNLGWHGGHNRNGSSDIIENVTQ